MSGAQSLLNKLIRRELENLQISKKYTGFKYLVDLIEFSFDDKSQDLLCLLNLVASANQVTTDAVEHNIKHMLLSALRNGKGFKGAISQRGVDEHDSKQLIRFVVNYVRSVII